MSVPHIHQLNFHLTRTYPYSLLALLAKRTSSGATISFSRKSGSEEWKGNSSFHSHSSLLPEAELRQHEESGNVISKTLLLSPPAGMMQEPASSRRGYLFSKSGLPLPSHFYPCFFGRLFLTCSDLPRNPTNSCTDAIDVKRSLTLKD